MGKPRVFPSGSSFSAWQRRAALLLTVVALVALSAPTPVRADRSYAAQERLFLELINGARRTRGLSGLAASPEVAAVARRWSRRMAADGGLRHNPRVGEQLPIAWRRWGENVGWNSAGGTALSDITRSLHRRFMNSDGHRANVLGRFNQVGIGVAIDRRGTMWATMVFVQGRLPASARRGVTDVAGTGHRAAIGTAVERGLITPCDAARRRFCPGRPASRATVAAAVSRLLDLAPGRVRHFRDVAAPSHVDALAGAGIARGCAPRRFCPDRAVTRGQLASLLVRALPALRPAGEGPFGDLDPTSVHAGAANGLAAAGVTRGCDASRFCPRRRVTRAQLASLVVRALEL